VATRKQAEKAAPGGVAGAGRGKPVPLIVPASEFERVVRSQHNYSKDLAEKIIQGGALDEMDRLYIAAVLRNHAAKVLLAKQPRKPGQAPKIDAGSVALLFASLTQIGHMTKLAAYERLAEQNDVSVQAIKNAVKEHGEAVARVMRVMGVGAGKRSIKSE
jgi:hypothetical protein